ncbi:MAG: nuclear transport factor 2 family protein [Caulobacteraceae bacterium]|nr:nuclear transport factor 2 family protein [Caulobacteraceae bacterium]
MRHLLAAVIATAFLSACVPQIAPATDAAGAVRKANEAYEKALLDGDAAALGAVLADDFTFIGWEGETMDKAAFIEDATRGHDMTVSSSRDVVIRAIAPTVVQVIGVWEGDTVQDGQTDHSVERFSNVWVKSAAGWRIELEHTSPLKASA